MKRILIFFVLGGFFLTCKGQTTLSTDVIDNVKLRINNGVNAGIVIGILDDDGPHYYSFGLKSLTTKEPVDEYSVFEIGSISKTFTGILLADMVLKEQLTLEDPLQNLLPEGVKAPTRNGKEIKLVHMANHTSSLPRMPNNFNPANPGNPFADYTEKQLYTFINDYELTRDIGSQYEYSNYAVGLIGHLLSIKNSSSYEDLMIEIITNPLKMENTRINLTPFMQRNLAKGHSGQREVENWDIPTLAGAGAIRSTAEDMLKYLAANMGKEKTKLFPAMQLAHKNSRFNGEEPIVGLGWHTMVLDGEEIIWHNGGTGGYRTFAGFLKGGTMGVVVLSNSNAGADDIGIHLLHSKSPLKEFKPSIGNKIREVIAKRGIAEGVRTYLDLKKNAAESYDFTENQLNSSGYYYLGNDEIEKALTLFKLNVEAFPNSSNVYDSYGEALLKSGNKEKAIENYKKSVEINPGHQGGLQKLKSLGVNTDNLTKEIQINSSILETYVGQYELAPGFILTISKEGSQMHAQATGQPQFAIFPKSENIFYFKVVEAQLTFNKNDDGLLESVTLFQNGQTLIGPRID